MSKRSFERALRKRIDSGRFEFSRARYHGPAFILANRTADASPQTLAAPHDEAFCDECSSPVALNPATLKQAPEGKILCMHCAGKVLPEDTTLRVNPDPLLDMLLEGWKLPK